MDDCQQTIIFLFRQYVSDDGRSWTFAEKGTNGRPTDFLSTMPRDIPQQYPDDSFTESLVQQLLHQGYDRARASHILLGANGIDRALVRRNHNILLDFAGNVILDKDVQDVADESVCLPAARIHQQDVFPGITHIGQELNGDRKVFLVFMGEVLGQVYDDISFKLIPATGDCGGFTLKPFELPEAFIKGGNIAEFKGKTVFLPANFSGQRAFASAMRDIACFF